MIYEYKVLDNVKKTIASRICFANCEKELREIVNNNNFSLISFKKKKILNKSRVFSEEEFTLPFFLNMNTLMSNNIDIINALKIMLNSFIRTEHKAIIQYLIFKISSGYSLHMAMSAVSDLQIFDKISIKTIQIAEQTATLNEAFTYVSRYLNNNIQIKKMLKNSMIYPTVLFIVMISVTAFWTFFIIPAFADSFSDMGIDIPLITVSLFHFRNCVLTHKLLTALIIIFSAVLLKKYRRQLSSKLPIIKTIRRNIQMITFFNSMSLMLNKQITFLEAMRFSIGLTNSQKIDAAISEIVTQITQGRTISHAFSNANIFTNQEIAIIEAGEQAGDVAGVFKIIANTLQENTQNIVYKLQNLLQPIATIIMGIMLLIIICSVFLPLYDQLGAYL